MIQQEMLQYQKLDSELNKIERELKKNEFYVKRKQYKALRQECEENLAKLDAKAAELRLPNRALKKFRRLSTNIRARLPTLPTATNLAI